MDKKNRDYVKIKTSVVDAQLVRLYVRNKRLHLIMIWKASYIHELILLNVLDV